jgi:hypothetical protein
MVDAIGGRFIVLISYHGPLQQGSMAVPDSYI